MDVVSGNNQNGTTATAGGQLSSKFALSAGSVPVEVLRNCDDSANQLKSIVITFSAQTSSPEFLYLQATANGQNPVAAVSATEGAFIGDVELATTDVLYAGVTPPQPADGLPDRPVAGSVVRGMTGDHEFYMERAFALALHSYQEGGCPIGAVLVSTADGRVLGEGHNALVQEGNPILHGEMAALRAAGRLPNRHHTTLYTTLQPCFMCTGAIVQFGIPTVVVGDTANASSDETLRFLRGKGVEVIVLDAESSTAARRCVELAARFRRENPALWLEDWGGGPNLSTK